LDSCEKQEKSCENYLPLTGLSSAIDLTSALIQPKAPNLNPIAKVSKIVPDKHFQPSTSDIVLLCNDNFFKQSDIDEKSSPSNVGNVICRQWRQPVSILSTEPKLCEIPIFKFDSPSPDDAIREAQKFSGVNRKVVAC